MDRVLTDALGQIYAIIRESEERIECFDAQGVLRSYYDKQMDASFDARGIYLGQGNLTLSALG